jgi:hypothetical protein
LPLKELDAADAHRQIMH